MLDFHNHLIPGVDDGAESIAQSRSALARMRDQGFDVIISTPHLQGSSLLGETANDHLSRIDVAWDELRALVRDEFPDLRVARGAEILLDSPRVDLSDERVRLAGTRFVLVEFPWSGIPIESAAALFAIKMNGFTPIVAHPERYADMDSDLECAEKWKESGAYLQINAGSLIGLYGARPESLAWGCLERGFASYMCSDYHARGKCTTQRANQLLAQRSNGDKTVQILTEVNPKRLIDGLDPLAVPSLARPKQLRWHPFRRRS
jgi:protein-tyrosine phosphatase